GERVRETPMAARHRRAAHASLRGAGNHVRDRVRTRGGQSGNWGATDQGVPPVIRYRLLIGTLSNCAGKVTAVGIWFFLTPFVLDRLGPHEYALWVLTGAMASYG